MQGMTQAQAETKPMPPAGALATTQESNGALVKPTKVIMGRPVAPNQVDPPVDELMGYLD
ncbi:MAG: hypothetical protein NZ482_04160 [Gloeomargarita sp. SKYG98]|nr:hypothetical protein [Gloeomargarita sp. SKYG98]